MKRIVVLGLALSSVCVAQEYPSQPVRIIVPYQPGGSDVLIRAIGVELSKKWKQPVVVENRPGADSIIGAEYVARSAPDGYTLLATVDSTTVVNRFLYKKLPYDPDKSFAPISLLAETEFMIFANPKVPASDLKELIALAKSKPGTISFGSYSKGSQADIMFNSFNKREGVDLLLVPYKGVAATLSAAVSGEISVSVGGYNVAGQLVKGGRLKPLAAAGPSRNPLYPEVKSAAERGFPYVKAGLWYGVFAPAGTPEQIVKRLTSDFVSIIKDKDFAEKNMLQVGVTPVGSTADELKQRIATDVSVTAEFVRSSGMQPE